VAKVEARIVRHSLAILSPITSPAHPATRTTRGRVITGKMATETHDGGETIQQCYDMPRVVPNRIALNSPHHRQAHQITPTSFMSSNQNRDTISSNAGSVAVIANTIQLVEAIGRQLSSSQEEQGDDKLNQARDLVTSEVQPMVEESDLRVIEEEIS
jgi:hypothetical protein